MKASQKIDTYREIDRLTKVYTQSGLSLKLATTKAINVVTKQLLKGN